MRALMIPGIGGSDEHHWQSFWQTEFGDRANRIMPASWDEPELDDWLNAISRAMTFDRIASDIVASVFEPADTVASDRGPADPETVDIVMVAHSLGCLAAANWLMQRGPGNVVGAFVVAPPDPDGPEFPHEVSVDLVWEKLPVPTLVLASSDDPYDPQLLAPRLASAWGADFEDVGRLGHINSESGLGRWDAGRARFDAFVQSLGLVR